MANRDLETATYVLKIVKPPHPEGPDMPVYMLENKDSFSAKEYYSPEDLVRGIIRNHDHLAELDDDLGNSKDVQNELKSQILALQTLLMSGKSQLDKLRFIMTDRITSAMTKMTLLKATKELSYSTAEESWLNQGLSDLTRLSFAIEEWTRLCELIDIDKLENQAEIEKMVASVSSFE